MARVTRSALAASQNHREPAETPKQTTNDESLNSGPIDADAAGLNSKWVADHAPALRGEGERIADENPNSINRIETTQPATPAPVPVQPPTPQHAPAPATDEAPTSTTTETTTPFPLSNLAFQSPPASSPSRHLSPRIESAISQALQNNNELILDDLVEQTAVPEVETAQDDAVELEDRRESVEQSPSRRKIVKSDNSITKFTAPTPPNPANSFKARPVPVYPTQQPRMTKTTAMRLGLEMPSSSNTTASRRQPSQEDSNSPASSSKRGAVITTAERAQAFGADHRRRDSAPIVASTARPRVEVRLTKAAALRTGVEWPKKERFSAVVAGAMEGKRPSSVGGQSVASQRGSIGMASPKSDAGGPVRPKPIQRQQSSTFSVTSQGSQTTSNATRRSSVVSSTRPPKIEPRMDRTTKLRLGMEIEAKRIRTETPVDFEGGQSSLAHCLLYIELILCLTVAGHRRKETIAVPSTTQAPSIQPRLNRSIHLQRTGQDSVVSAASRRATAAALAAASLPTRAPKVMRPSTAPPRIAPIMNRTEQLRAAKKEAESAAEAKEARREAIWKAKGLAGPTPAVSKPLSEIN